MNNTLRYITGVVLGILLYGMYDNSPSPWLLAAIILIIVRITFDIRKKDAK